ncbi:amidase [Alicyclobacillus dauci]|uniref:Amidase n=2 Tax=Alicyclobacillus dauci TaxID=1475485 RepID=A0ABY6Z8L7_9BACL|nr:amidase [Alicyclobacillus dauci]
MSATELATKINQREISPVEVTEFFIQRIEERNKSINAFVYFAYEEALARAKEAERAVLRDDSLGPLHGVPTALKDLFCAKPGWISTFGGIRVLKDNVVYHSCSYGERLEGAGAIFLGKTNSPTLGFNAATDNYLFGATRNPFDLTRNAGGSSGGSAAAVADGLLPIAEGTDTGGSIRIPAAMCGVFGFKPGGGRVPYLGRPNGFRTYMFSTEGTLTRTVEDAAVGLSLLTGYDDRDPYSSYDKVDFMSALRGSVKGWRIAYSPNFDVFPVDRRVSETVSQAVRLFELAGATVEEVKVGIPYHQRELSDLFCRVVMQGAMLPLMESFKTKGLDILRDYRDDLPQHCLDWIEKTHDMTALDANFDQIMRTQIFDSIQNVFQNYDLLITPTVCVPPTLNQADGNSMGPTQINGEEVNPFIGWCMTYLTNFTGHPTASIPAGLTDENHPIGMQIIGKRYADGDVLTASAVFEQLKPWFQTYELCKDRPLNV